MKKLITEADVEENVLGILESLDYDIIRRSNEEYLPSGSSALRKGYQDVIIIDELRYALKKLSHTAPKTEAITPKTEAFINDGV